MGYWPLKDPLAARSRSIFTAFGLYHCGEVNDLSLHRKGPGTALIDRHLYLKVKIIKTKHSSQTYVIDPKMCWNSFHSMTTAVSAFSPEVFWMCEAESVTLYFSRAIPYGFSFLFYKWKKTFEPFIRKIPYKSWFIYTITLVYTSKLQNGGLAAQFSIHCCLKRESGRIFLKQINSVLRTSSRSHVVSFLDLISQEPVCRL